MAKLESLKFEPAKWRLEPTAELVVDREREFALKLPTDYREFLLHYGGYFGSGRSPCLEPTPFGETAIFDGFYGFMPKEYSTYDLRWAVPALGAPPHFVPVAIGSLNGCTLLLKCTGKDAGSVYFYDADQRSFWSDDEFYRMFPNLHPKLVQYLELRRSQQLPTKPDGYESLYLLGNTFTEFADGLQPDTEDNE